MIKMNPQPLPPSTDDRLERALKSAAIGRKPFNPPFPATSDHPEVINREQLMELHRNCIRLAAENKINQKNTWELPLIDHLSEIIRVELEDENESDFRKAGRTLEAGVRIYSLRVDSLHTKAYKVLGGINRVELVFSGESAPRDHFRLDQGGGYSGKETDVKISPLSTITSSTESLNVKKFDVTVAADPLYHQTTAQFEKGGAKSLLLNNLGVYGECSVLFDSFEVPENVLCAEPVDQSVMIDLSFANEYIEPMAIHMLVVKDISPTLREILNQFTYNDSTDVLSGAPKKVGQDGDIHNDLHGGSFDDYASCDICQDDRIHVTDDNSSCAYPNFGGHQEERNDYMFQEPYNDETVRKIAGFLSLNMGIKSKSNTWAGPDYWKFWKSKGFRVVTSKSGLATKKPTGRQCLGDIDFIKFLENELPVSFNPPKNPRSIMLPGKRDLCHIMLPEDCHYVPDSLVKLFLLPTLMCLGSKGGRFYDGSGQQNSYSNTQWDNTSLSNAFDCEHVYTDEGGNEAVVCQPRQVSKISVQFGKLPKKVDIRSFKEILWTCIQESCQIPEGGSEATVSLRHVLHHFASDGAATIAAVSPEDISPHLFFICLLHLANEHCLNLRGYPSLDELDIIVSPSAVVK